MKSKKEIQSRISELKKKLVKYQIELDDLKSCERKMKEELSDSQKIFDYTSCMNCMDSYIREIEFCYDKLIKTQNSISDLEWVIED